MSSYNSISETGAVLQQNSMRNINLIRGNIIKVNRPLCSSCSKDSQLQFLDCRDSVCYVCLADQLFRVKKFLCPKCKERLSYDSRMKSLDFLEYIYKNELNVSTLKLR